MHTNVDIYIYIYTFNSSISLWRDSIQVQASKRPSLSKDLPRLPRPGRLRALQLQCFPFGQVLNIYDSTENTQKVAQNADKNISKELAMTI